MMRIPLSTSLNAHKLNSFSAVTITGRMNLPSNEWPVIYDNNKVKHVALVVAFLCLLSKIKSALQHCGKKSVTMWTDEGISSKMRRSVKMIERL